MKTLKLSLLLLIFSTSIFALSCTSKSKYNSCDLFAMDTFITISAENASDSELSGAKKVIKEIENVFSKSIASSDIYNINNSHKSAVSAECVDIIKKAIEISDNTSGAFNPCMGLISNLWDITGKAYIPSDNEISALLPYCDPSSLTFTNMHTIEKRFTETQLDLGAAVKGYAAGKVIDNLKTKGINNAMTSIGGNIAVTGSAPNREGLWRVAIKNPFMPDRIAGYIDCTDKVISVSGDYERFFEKDGNIYHHIFNPITGKPANNGIKSVAVISSDGLVSDCLSTALFVMGKDEALEFYDKKLYEFEAIIFTDSGNVYLTEGIKNDFILTDNNSFKIIT